MIIRVDPSGVPCLVWPRDLTESSEHLHTTHMATLCVCSHAEPQGPSPHRDTPARRTAPTASPASCLRDRMGSPVGEGPSCRLCRLCGVVSREQQMFALPWCAPGSSLEKLTCVQDLDQGHPTPLRLSVAPWDQPVSRSSFGGTCHRMGNFACFCQITCTCPGDLQPLPVRCECLLTVINGFPWCRQLRS